eukprot:2756416-Amphidinium_carterae.1
MRAIALRRLLVEANSSSCTTSGVLETCSSIKRPIMGGPNRVKSAGIHTIEIYYPQYYIRQTEMEDRHMLD